MKKIVYVAAVALAGTILLPSCKKDYTCSCTYDDGTGGATTIDATISNSTKAKAKAACDLMDNNYLGFTNVQCDLK